MSVSCPFAGCRAQELGSCPWGEGSWLLRGPTWLGGHSRALCAECLRRPNPASPQRRTHWELVSGSGEPQQISRAQGARGSPAPLCPTACGVLGGKTACVAFLSKGGVGLVLLGEERFLSLCRLQPPGAGLVPLGSRGLGAVQPSLARGALLGPGRRRPSQAQSCFPTKEKTLRVGFRRWRPPAKHQGPGR